METAPPAVLTMNGGDFCFGKIPPSWAHKRTPKMGSLLANILAFPSCLKFLQTGVRSRWQKFLQSYLRAPVVSAFGLPNADASAESLTLRKNIEALAPLFLRAPREVPEGTSGRPSSATSWGAPRSGIKNRYTEHPFCQGKTRKFCSPAKHGRHASMNTKLRAKPGEAVGTVVSS